MDRMIHTALNSLANLRDQRVVSAQNLANVAVPGFRRDLTNEGSAKFVTALDSLSTRALQLERGAHGFSRAAGPLDRTGDPMDLAIADRGFFFVQPPEGGEAALSRRGDLQLGPGGVLQNGAGEAMLGADLQPIILPPFRELEIDDLGQIVITPQDGAPGERALVGRLATVDPADDLDLRKTLDGRIRMADGSALPPPDQRARVLQGVREGSNVNATEEMIDSIELQRTFELNLRLIQTAREVDEAGAALLRPPGS
ncbi:flagellar basal body rod protein FlgF [Pseudotabrizicola algicola]|uniref:Flagellar basal-body rod protein FlgF n=1 Tax=Pseudotabrizicola algicola TaxID=2709381 RepID=A0A6B3RQ55_9RHOB|nr:flagellar basal body rod C-terminal domain-containing protein [Pseudotabrizicola algicola]NEX45249.1 flagellar biosynthesis protein FlgF [Pseudotabrizicola algicola]